MYIMHPKEEFLLHLGQEQGISNVMSFEHICTARGCLGLPLSEPGLAMPLISYASLLSDKAQTILA